MDKTINADQVFSQQTIATLPTPWSIAFMPNGQMLISELPPAGESAATGTGNIRIVTAEGAVSAPIKGLPDNFGVLDIELDPNFAQNHVIYFSFMERDPNAPRIGRNADDPDGVPAGIAVARAVLDLSDPTTPALTTSKVIWQQTKVIAFPGSGEPGGRIAFSPDGHLFIAAGDRQEFEPVQSLANTLGKIIRINPDGTIPVDNPFVGIDGARPEIWSLGHRNPYGLMFTEDGHLWQNEMGPKGGDELNVITSSANYGWPHVSYGNHYDGAPIPKPAAGDGYAPSAMWWTPVIAPSSMMQYSGNAFADWKSDLIISGLQSKGLVIVDPDGTSASEVGRIDLGQRVRDVVQGPDGALWVIFDQPDGRLVKLSSLTVSDILVRGDIDGDGKADAVLQGINGGVSVLASTGSTFSDVTSFDRSLGSEWTIAANGDFNGNGQGDLLLRRDDGTVTTWLSSSKIFDNNDGAIFRKVSADWIIAGTGDFNGDGRTDILWRNRDGVVTDWLSTGVGFADNAAAGRAASLAWHIAGTGDFNGDNKDDILWRNDNGMVTTWLSNGPGFAGSVSFERTLGLNWNVAATGDFNGDGKSDILWRSAGGAVTTWLSTGVGFAENAAFNRVVDRAWQIAGTGDYNADGKDDLLWQNTGGTITTWLSSGISFVDSGVGVHSADLIVQPSAAADRTIFASADFNGDGKDDILWRNADRTVTDWFGTSTAFSDNPAVSRVISADWRIVGTGDFNGDGKADLLWRHADGTITDWLAGGKSFADNAAATRIVPVEWRVQATADFNGDGKDDILWRHANGTITDWLSAGSGFSDNGTLSRQIDSTWHVEGAGDFNGDGRADILWRNDDGTVTNWFSNGIGFSDNANLSRVVPSEWHVAGVGDFNGDGKDDILWRNDNGTVTDWFSTGTGFADNAALSRTVPVGWQVSGVGDYNGDGRDDIFWRHDDGTVINWLSNGNSFEDNLQSLRNITLDWDVQHDSITLII